MAGSVVRRPLPALIALVALLLLTALVWWRVLNRDSSSGSQATPCPTPSVSTPTTSALPAPSSINLLVLNGTSRRGIATAARRSLTTAGFQSPLPPGNFTTKKALPGVAQIRFGTKSRAAAALVRYYLPGAVLMPTDTTKPLVTVILGRRYARVAAAATVRNALAADHVRVPGVSTGPTARRTTC